MHNKILALLFLLGSVSTSWGMMEFDGSNDYMTAGNFTALAGSSVATVSAWIYPRSAGGGGFGRIIQKGDGGSVFGLFMGGSATSVTFAINGYSNSFSITSGQWNHVLGRYDSSSNIFSVYVNGSLVSNLASNGSISSTSDTLEIGNRSSNDRAFDGYIDDIRIYNRALSEAEIENLGKSRSHLDLTDGLVAWWPLNEGSDGSSSAAITFDSVGSNHGTFTNFSNAYDAHISTTNGLALNLDGDSTWANADYVNLGDTSSLNITGNITITAWVNGTSISSDYRVIVAKSKGNSDAGYEWRTESGTGKQQFYILNGSAQGVTSNTAVTSGAWHHLAARYDGSTVKVFLDGTEDGSASASGSMATSVEPAAIGFRGIITNSPGQYPWKGMIDDVRIYNVAISTQDVADIYSAGIEGVSISTQPISQWKFNQPPNIYVARDKSGNQNNATPSNGPIWKASSWVNYP